jgi:hypothetical protein
MNTSLEAVKRLQQALAQTRDAQKVIDDLIVEHDYQDVATLVTQAAAALLESAALLMQSQDEAALDALESADELLDSVYSIIDAETDED